MDSLGSRSRVHDQRRRAGTRADRGTALRNAELAAAERYLGGLRAADASETLATTPLYLDVLGDLAESPLAHLLACPVPEVAGKRSPADAAASDPITVAAAALKPSGQ